MLSFSLYVPTWSHWKVFSIVFKCETPAVNLFDVNFIDVYFKMPEKMFFSNWKLITFFNIFLIFKQKIILKLYFDLFEKKSMMFTSKQQKIASFIFSFETDYLFLQYSWLSSKKKVIKLHFDLFDLNLMIL